MTIEVILSSEYWDKPVRLTSGRTVQVGRDPELADIVLPVAGVSKRHCELACKSETVIVRDLGSTNGSFINGRWISESLAHDDDVIGVGPKAAIRIKIEQGDSLRTCSGCESPLTATESSRGGRYRDSSGTYCLNCALSDVGDFEQFGPYRLLSQIGVGATGRVLEAVDRRDGSRIALKLLRTMPGDTRSGYREARFQREIEVLRKLDHPAIVCYHDSGQVIYQPYLAMEYIIGSDVGLLLTRQDRPFELDEVTPIIDATCGALAFAHQQDVIHRDIKPGNILIDEQGNVRLTDFGLALKVDSDSVLTADGGILGTLEFMAPEQIQDPHCSDARADIYGLAATVFYLLTGERPYVAHTDYELITSILERPVPHLSAHRKDLPLDVDALLHQAMAKDPADRPQTPLEFADRWRSSLPG